MTIIPDNRLQWYAEQGLVTKYDLLAWYDMSEYAAEDIAYQVQQFLLRKEREKAN